jgi:hypothetical protein
MQQSQEIGLALVSKWQLRKSAINKAPTIQ